VNEADYKRIIVRRDRRYDGRFYFGVKTTGIYCRPVCPAKPKPDNMRIFRSASEAEAHGYRACLRCRPDAAPGNKLWDGTIHTVSRALKLIQHNAKEEVTVEELARTLHVTDRHLRRLFDEHLGASPIQILQTQRLHFARQAIQDTQTPITDIAFASGFQSIRQFNETFKARFRRAPSDFRKNRQSVRGTALSLRIPIRLPYDWFTTLAYLKRHETYGVERISDGIYQRFIPRGKTFGRVAVSYVSGESFLRVEFTDIPLIDVRGVLVRLRNLFDTDHNPLHLPSGVPVAHAGIRVPGCFDPFETAVSIILSQLVTTEQATAKLKAVVLRFGKKRGEQAGRDVWSFPTPTSLARAKLEKIGMPRTRAGAIRALAQAAYRGALDFDSHPRLAEMEEKLLAIKGIGPWTASMIAMRCLGDADAFPASDLVIQRVMEQKKVRAEEWAASRAYLTHCLWRDFGKAVKEKRSNP